MFKTVWFAVVLSVLTACSSKPVPPENVVVDEDDAVAYVLKFGGKIARDENAPGKPVWVVNLRDTQVTDEGLKELAPLTKLNTLYLSGEQVTDAGLKQLAPFKNLTSLDLNITQVTDAGVKELQQALPQCKIRR